MLSITKAGKSLYNNSKQFIDAANTHFDSFDNSPDPNLPRNNSAYGSVHPKREIGYSQLTVHRRHAKERESNQPANSRACTKKKTHMDLCISSEPVCPMHSFPASQYDVLRQADLVNDKKIERVVGTENVNVVKQLFDLLIWESAATAKAAVEDKDHKSKTAQEGSGGIIKVSLKAPDHNSLRSQSVKSADPYKTLTSKLADALEEPFNHSTIKSSILKIPHNPLAGWESLNSPKWKPEATIFDDPHPVLDVPGGEVAVIVERDSKELFVRKADRRIFHVEKQPRAINWNEVREN